MSKRLLFVYGILKREAGGFFDREDDCEFVCRAQVPNHDLVRLGGIAGMVKGDKRVAGEVWAVGERTMARCDGIEGHPHHYRRTPVFVELFAHADQLGEGVREVEAYIYQHQRPEMDFYPDEDGVVSWPGRRDF